MIVKKSEEVPRKKVKTILGVDKGNTVRAKNIGRDIAASFKNIIGGEIKSYTDLMTQAREEAYNRMVNKIVNEATNIGFSRRTGGVLLPKSTAVIKALEEGIESGVPFTLQEIDNLRKQAGRGSQQTQQELGPGLATATAGQARWSKGRKPLDRHDQECRAIRHAYRTTLRQLRLSAAENAERNANSVR